MCSLRVVTTLEVAAMGHLGHGKKSVPRTRHRSRSGPSGDARAEGSAGQGVEVVFDNVGEAVMGRSMDCIAYNGRYLMMGFASDKTVADEKLIVPRRVTVGNFKLCGVMLAYVQADRSMMLKAGMGWNFPSDALGQKIHEQIVAKVLNQRVRPVIGKVVEFDDVPAAFDAMPKRETVGRTIVTLYKG
jgi:NADPH2:quinone reductase